MRAMFYTFSRDTFMSKRNSSISLIFILSALVGGLMFTRPVLAQYTCAGAETSVIDCTATGSTGESAVIELVKIAIQILAAGIGIVAVGAVIYGAILYGSSGSTPENVKKAKTMWVNVVIGLALFAFLMAITNFLIPGGIIG